VGPQKLDEGLVGDVEGVLAVVELVGGQPAGACAVAVAQDVPFREGA
jgi:hypothetical protein